MISPKTERTIPSVEALAEECRRIQHEGYAVDKGEYDENIRCVAAPIRDPSGSIVASIGIAAPAHRLSAESALKMRNLQ